MKLRKKIILSALAALAVSCFAAACTVQNPPEVPPENPPGVTDPDDFKQINITGADDIKITQGAFFDCFAGVAAVNADGKDLSAYLNVSGNLNTSRAGEYFLVYYVTDLNGVTVEKQRKITVEANPAIGRVKPVPVYSIIGGADYNIAEGCGANVTATSNGSENKALDGDFATRWESDHKVDNVNFTVNLGASLSINEINIYWEAAYAEDFTLQVSDNAIDWTDVEYVKGQALAPKIIGGIQQYVNNFPCDDLTAQFVRIACEKRKEVNYGYSIFEIEILGPTGTVIPYEQYPDLLDAEKEGSPDWNKPCEEWILFDLGSVKALNRIRIAFQNNLFPASYEVSYAVNADGHYTKLNLFNLPYSADTLRFNGENDVTINARYIKIELHSLRFIASAYRINEIALINAYSGGNGEEKLTAAVTASSAKEEHGAALLTDGRDDTYWENDNDGVYQTVDLGEIKAVGRVDLYWRGDDGGKGKYYDLQISLDGGSWTTVFRQTHGATARQSVYVYENARYVRVIDYQSPDTYRYMLEGMVIRSQYPASSGEGKVEYDVSTAFPKAEVIDNGNGSYVTGGTDFPSSRLIAYLDNSLRGKPVPSNDWWQGLLIADKGYNMYMNPLTATFKSDGLWLTNPGEGYFDGFVPGNGSQTVDVDAHDIAVGYAGMGKDAEVRVTGYSDYGISAVMTDDAEVDKLTVFLSEGALYAYCIFAEPEKALIKADNFIAFYDLDGNKILQAHGSAYTGDGIVAQVLTHSGYVGGVRKFKDSTGAIFENDPLFEERYYVISVPEDTVFVCGEGYISVKMTGGNYMSVGAVGQKNEVRRGESSGAEFPLEEVKILHEHGYAFVINTSCLYAFDGETNTVTTEFRLRTMLMRAGWSAEPYSAYLPHQTAQSECGEGYIYKCIRGDCLALAGNSFVTRDKFYGVVPTFAEPTDEGYSSLVLYNQLLMVYENNGGDKAPEDSNLISGDPYWQGKNLHPMAMAAIAADQIGATDLRDKFLDKIEYILTDWFTYDSEKDKATGAYFYYDGEWGTLYYKNSEFGAGVNLADHYFTYGYYTLAAGVLTSYRPEFAEQWGNMVELLIRDYMNPSREDELFPYMRNFDPFAGHGWAGGYADNNGGNNQESAGEALNSWVGAYLYATAVGNEEVRTAAIYGYTTELNAIKHYWFDYFGDFPDSYRYGVAGQVYGGSNFYGTFFNGEPLYMYGIHLIPGEEYLTSYALNVAEREKLEGLIDKMREEQAGWEFSEADESHREIYAWQHIFIPIVAIYDADKAIAWYEEVLQKQGNVGNTSEQFNVYYLIHGMKSTGVRTTDIWAENGASATVYVKDGAYTALCWNPAGTAKEFVFRSRDGVVGSALIPANSLVSCDPTTRTAKFASYEDASNFKLENVADSVNSTISAGQLSLGAGGSADYLLSFGSEQTYYRIKISGAEAGVKLLIDGTEIPLNKTADGYESNPVSLSFKHTVTVSGNNVKISAISFEGLTLQKSDITRTAKATASSSNGTNTADKVIDGIYNNDGRWESIHQSDNEWLEIELEALTEIYQMRVYWEAASAKEYKVYFSQTGDGWTEVFHGNYSQGARTDIINPSVIMSAKYIRIEGISRTTDYGYSIYEIELYNFNNI